MPAEKLTAAELQHKYDRLWKRLEYEVSLVSQRMIWFIAIQAFLLTALSIAIKDNSATSIRKSLLFPSVPILGLIIATLAFATIVAGLRQASTCRSELRTLKMENKKYLDSVDLTTNVRLGAYPLPIFCALFGLFWILILWEKIDFFHIVP